MSIRIPVPPSPQSTSSALSGSPPALDPTTLALLTSFIAAKTEEERRFNELAEQAAARVAGLALELDSEDSEVDDKPMISVDEYRLAFGEDWQLSQFWYTTPFAMRLARILHSLCSPETSIAFLCCPTAFVAFQHEKPLRNARLLEFDGRFGVLSPRQYVPYDMEEPTKLPADLTENFDLVVVDPPFLNEYTNANVVKTLHQIMRPTGKLIVITSTSVTSVLDKLYDSAPLGPLRKTQIEVEHGQLRNDFACWGSWEGAEELGAGDGNEHEH
ncbi:putative N6-adenine methyltransferase-domain-containing protein [Mycena alexandri]|uniref:N6-adenine methyltransferase-domain-containing protein n=1 Tax=Mycena alexandri TaxID=1745969 RepID=A0AAD6WMU2_9AGAR|nr:putative N6-adenine methyltransferase-domain-containing protein [Mycena alexandri]